MRTFAIVNQKGGCGKTTTAINLAAVFARRGLRTLLVDMDPQSHCAIGLGVPEASIDRSIGEALLTSDKPNFDPRGLAWEVSKNLDLIPSTMRLAALEAPGGGLHQLPDRDRRLSRLLAHFAARYDRCLIDCPPTVGLLTFNALRAAREAIIPVETGFFALRGASKQWQTIRQLIDRIGRPIACHLIPTLYDKESTLATDILNTLRQEFAGQVLPIVIHEDMRVREAASFGQPITEYAPDSAARADFESLADWLDAHPPGSSVQIEIMSRDVPSPGVPNSPTTLETTQSPPIDTGLPTQSRAAELARLVRGLQTRPEDPTLHETPPSNPVISDLPESVSATSTASQITATDAKSFGAHPTADGVRFLQPGGPDTVIAIAGEFNRWSPVSTPLTYVEELGVHQTHVSIPPGTYQYRLVVDGRWQADPYNAHKRINEYEESNSLLFVPESHEL